MRKYLLVALLAATAATPALGQDRAPFTGPRAEAIIGYETTDVEDENSGGLVYGGYGALQQDEVVFVHVTDTTRRARALYG